MIHRKPPVAVLILLISVAGPRTPLADAAERRNVPPRRPVPTQTRVQPRKAPAPSKLTWTRFEIHWNLLFQGAGTYSSGLGFAFTPRYRTDWGISFAVTAGAQLAKSAEGGLSAIPQLGGYMDAPLGGGFWISPEAGLALQTSENFPYYGLALGYQIPGTGIFRKLSLHYDMLAANTPINQILVGAAITW